MTEAARKTEWGLSPQFHEIPSYLQQMDRWVMWQAHEKPDGKVAKKPIQPNGIAASTRNPATWASFKDCKKAFERHPGRFNGIGFVMTDMEDPVTFIDLDGCFENGKLNAQAKAIVQAAQSYTEKSPSGKGVRVFLKGDAGAFVNNAQGVEVYTQDSTRFVTITGHKGNAWTPAIKPSDDLVEELSLYRPAPVDRESAGDPIDDLGDHDIERICVDLCKTNPEMEHYEPWLALGLGLHHQFQGDPRGLEIWIEASGELPNFDLDECEMRWDSFGKGGGQPLTLRSVLANAKEAGVSLKSTACVEDFPDDLPDLDEDIEPPAEGAGMDDALDDPEPADDTQVDTPRKRQPPGAYRASELANVPPPRMLVEDLLARGSVAMITGPSNAGKTFLALELARAVAGGWKYAEHYRTKQSPVLYCAFEGSAAIHQRIRSWEALGVGIPDDLIIADDMPILNPRKPDSLKAFRDYIRDKVKRFGTKMVVIDTLAASTPGMSTNSEEDVGALFKVFRDLAHSNAQLTMVLIHHSAKAGMNGVTSRVRGSSIMEGDADTLVYVERTKGDAVEADWWKQRMLSTRGVTQHYAIRKIKTGMQTDFGRREEGAYLDWTITESETKSPAEVDLRDRLRGALRKAGGSRLSSGGWLTTRDEWLAEHYPDVSTPRRNDVVRTYLGRVVDEFHVERGGGGRVAWIGPKTARSEGAD